MIFLVLFIWLVTVLCCVMVQCGGELANPDGKARHPVRAFLITPIAAAVIYMLLVAGKNAARSDSLDYYTYFLTHWDGYVSKLPVLAYLMGLAMLFLALPVYSVLKKIKIEHAVVTIILAGLIAGFFFVFPSILSAFSTGSKFSYSAEGCRAMVDNVRTACGWKLFYEGLSVYTTTGLLSGVAFWRLYAGRWVMRI